MLRKLLSAMLVALILGMLAIPVAASTVVEHQGLQLTIEMDKETYDAGEPITATLTLVNISNQTVTVVNLEQLIPEGYVATNEAEVAKRNFDILPGQTVVLQVTFVGDPDQLDGNGEGSFLDKILYGETWGIPNILLVVVGLIAFGIFMILT